MLTDFKKYAGSMAKLTMVTLLLTTSICLGQSRRGDVIANVPFPFMVANHALPPGRYIVTPIGETNFRIYGNQQSFIFQTNSVLGRSPGSIGKLVFHRYGGSYFLAEVWSDGNSAGRELFTSQAEKELALRTSGGVAVLRSGLD